MFKWLLSLTSIKFSTSSSSFNASAAVISLFSSSSATISGSSSDWLVVLAASRTCSAKLEKRAFQINSLYKASRSSRGDWKESQSRFWIWTRNTSKLFFLWRCKSCKMDQNSLENLDNELHVKVNKYVKQKHPCVFYFPNQSLGVHH